MNIVRNIKEGISVDSVSEMLRLWELVKMDLVAPGFV